MIMNINKRETMQAIMIIEVLGRPPEHLTETLNNIIAKLGEEKEIEILDKKINEPVVMEENKEFFTSFAEIEFEVKGISTLVDIMFKYMPSNIEISSPESLYITNTEFNEIFNALMRKLHGYDEIARVLQTEKVLLQRKLREVMEKQEVSEKSKKK
jgi:hypothetical protein